MRLISQSLLLTLITVVYMGCSKPPDDKPVSITRFNPSSAKPGEIITLVGTNFSALPDSGGAVRVYFLNQSVTGGVTSDSTIEVVVPFNAGDGPVCIQAKSGRICSSQSFDYLQGNPTENSYMRLADCPNTATNQVAAMVATNDAILAGFINWWKYTIDQNTWAPMVAPTDKVTRAAGFTYNGKAYLFGGTVMGAGFSNRLQCYDPATNTWSFKTPLPSTARSDANAFVWNNKVYIAGGTDTYSLGFNTVGKQVWQYDPVADTWRRLADMPEGAGEWSYALRIGNRFYFPSAGSYGVQEYDPATDSWRQFWPTNNLPIYAVPYSDKNFDLGYVIGGRQGSYPIGGISRLSVNLTAATLFSQDYNQAPVGGYNTISNAFHVVVGNEVYYGMGYLNMQTGVPVSQTNQFWRYRY